MLIHRVIIHELNKPQGQTGAKLSKSLSLMDVKHEDVIKLVTELNKRYRRRDEKQGIFDNENPTIFHNTFQTFQDLEDDDSFIDFSIKSSENLKDKIEGIGPARGGYLVFAHYEDYRNYCAVFFVRDTTSFAFKRNRTVNSFDLNKVEHIDFEKLAMACRINLETFGNDQSKYLSFIHTKSDDLSQYFVRWISTKDTVTSEEDTNSLLKALRLIPIPVVSAGEEQLDREATIKYAHDYIKSSPTHTVNILEMSKTLFKDENYLTDYLYEKFPDVPTEFKAHNTTLKQFVRVMASADQIELNFHPNAYKNGIVRFDQKDPTQIIIKSKDLADQIKESINSN